MKAQGKGYFLFGASLTQTVSCSLSSAPAPGLIIPLLYHLMCSTSAISFCISKRRERAEILYLGKGSYCPRSLRVDAP